MNHASADVMYALHLALDVAYHDGTERDLAVASEAYALAGFYDPMISHASMDEVRERVAQARRGRNKRLLRADGRGMLAALVILADAGIVNSANAAEACRKRWLARGGHDGPPVLASVSGRVEEDAE